jgi:hypothetical protein
MELLVSSIKFDITPTHPVSLLGYFNDRISTGVADPLFCRLLALESGESRLLIVQADSCLIPNDDAESLRKRICSQTLYKPEELLICTTHTHTAPALVDFYGARREDSYRTKLYSRIAERVTNLKAKTRCRVKTTRFSVKGLSHNRRWFMSDGKVVTNPPKGSVNRVKPEGTVDEEVILIGIFSEKNDVLALLVNISNHTDSVGGTEISADWPGFMERFVEEELGVPLKVITLIAPQGNINHYDFNSSKNQTSLEEARRIGRAYGKAVLSNLSRCETVYGEKLFADLRYVDIAPREICDADLERARDIVKTTRSTDDGADLKAEDLETPAVLRIFSSQLLAFHDAIPPFYSVPLQVMRLGSIYLCAIPGEPFVEIGLELKQSYKGITVVPVSLANGYFGYIPLERSFDYGGYEVKQGVHNCLSRKAEGIILESVKEMLDRLTLQDR